MGVHCSFRSHKSHLLTRSLWHIFFFLSLSLSPTLFSSYLFRSSSMRLCGTARENICHKYVKIDKNQLVLKRHTFSYHTGRSVAGWIWCRCLTKYRWFHHRLCGWSSHSNVMNLIFVQQHFGKCVYVAFYRLMWSYLQWENFKTKHFPWKHEKTWKISFSMENCGLTSSISKFVHRKCISLA